MGRDALKKAQKVCYVDFNFDKILLIILIVTISSCKLYKQDFMFRLDDEFSEDQLSTAVIQAQRNYVIQKNDYLTIDVFTNRGERIIDPNNELQLGGNQRQLQQLEFTYLVQQDGTVKLPIIDQILVVGLTLNQAEDKLEAAYDSFYKDSFVKLNYNNKRVIVLGALGGQLVPLVNENMSLIEILAMAGGLQNGSKAQNIRVIRGSLDNPEVFQVDLSTVSGMKNTVMTVEPGDVIYVEPWRRPVLSGIRDFTPILSVFSSTLALILVLQN